jgi:hypothetical protein
LQENEGLKICDLSFNGFHVPGCHALGEALAENMTLRELDISHNRVDIKAIGFILKGLQTNETLQCIRVG